MFSLTIRRCLYQVLRLLGGWHHVCRGSSRRLRPYIIALFKGTLGERLLAIFSNADDPGTLLARLDPPFFNWRGGHQDICKVSAFSYLNGV